MQDFDVIVIGGGHAGCEAAAAAAKMGCKTAMLTLNPERIGFMSCNPAMGGLAKGQLIKEIDALGGVMGVNTDRSAIQYRRLNSSKGPAVRSSRAQCDKALYALNMQNLLKALPNLSILPFEAVELWVEQGKVSGVILRDESRISAGSVVVTTGTFLGAVMHTGFEQTEGGRVGDRASVSLSQSIRSLGFKMSRLKTGTPPRIHRDSIDYSQTEVQPGDEKPVPFSFYYRGERFPELDQLNCFIVYTNAQTHEIIEQNFNLSPMFTGVIKGIGPRYCPSIEDKVKRFRERDRHQLFLEPEGLDTPEIYVNGISTSLPREVQDKFVRSINGLHNAKFIRYGYAVEYDAVDARQLKRSLESKDVLGLYFAGQINGTSGYEEAGAQGLIAGINAARRSLDQEGFYLRREDAYIGVLIDDLILKGTDEPYRMFTSRAEYRLLLREDNADLRLSDRGYGLGLLSTDNYEQFCQKRDRICKHRSEIKTYAIAPDEKSQEFFKKKGLLPLKEKTSAERLLRRPEISFKDLLALGYPDDGLSEDIEEQVETQVKYEGYIQRDLEILEGLRQQEDVLLPANLDFNLIPGLSVEIRSKLLEVRPETLGQASRLYGVTPAAMANLLIFIRGRESQVGVRT